MAALPCHALPMLDMNVVDGGDERKGGVPPTTIGICARKKSERFPAAETKMRNGHSRLLAKSGVPNRRVCEIPQALNARHLDCARGQWQAMTVRNLLAH